MVMIRKMNCRGIPMSDDAAIFKLDQLDEPSLSFGYGQSLPDPKDGLFMFGPVIDHTKPAEMRVGVIGTAAGIRKYRAWVKSSTNFIPAKKADQHHLAFPGFEAAFRTKWPEKPIVELEIPAAALSNAVRVAEPHKRVF